MEPTRKHIPVSRQTESQAPSPKRPPPGVPIWVLLVLSGVLFVVCAGIWGYVSLTRPVLSDQPTAEAEFIVMTSAAGEAAENTPEPTLFMLGTATPVLTPTIPTGPSGQIQIGTLVQVTGTGSDGLRLRQTPSLAGEVNYLAIDFEVFRIQDGPIQADDFTWWSLVALDDSTRNGWAVENFLQVIQNP